MRDERRSPSPSPRSSAQPPRVRDDTIVAVGTAAGRSAIAVIRVSGPRAEELGRSLIVPWPARARELSRCQVRRLDGDRDVIDEALVAFFPAPRSFTGEDVVEVHSHGGSYVPAAIAAAFATEGARPAAPGEFTERALLNGKLDLIRAEAIGEIIDARTRASHRAALHALSGALTRQISSLREKAIAVEALLAFDIDFPEEDDGPVSRDRVEEAAADVERQLAALAATAPAAAIAGDGAIVVLAGPPNAGKSSLMNALIGESRVIVSDEPGTTRDAVEVLVDSEPWPMRLVDTAGLRNDAGAVERLGIEVSERYLARADVVLLCAVTAEAMNTAFERVKALTGGRIVRVRTKADISAEMGGSSHDACARVSAVTGEGLPELRSILMREVAARAGGVTEASAIVTSARQRAAIDTALAEIREFRTAWRDRALPAPVVATHLRAAVGALDELIGAVDVDEILARVFSTFCVGK
jgi:tRNA modification GTPase